jgi:hypothetical protein
MEDSLTATIKLALAYFLLGVKLDSNPIPSG